MQRILEAKRRDSQSRKRSAGFTLIELLTVMPLIILIISAMVVAIVNLTGTSMRTSARTQLQNEVLAALDQIEQDVKISTDFDGMASDKISMHNLATSANPLSANRKLIKKSDCSVAGTGISVAEALVYKMEYSVVGGNTLKRKATMDSGCGSSSNVWQRGVDDTLISAGKEVKLSVTTNSDTVEVKLTASKTVAGDDISYTGWLYVKSLNF